VVGLAVERDGRQATDVKRADDLYGLPLDEFTKRRDELVRELRRAGKKEAADHVKALRKPTTSVWIVNQLARRHPQETAALVKAGEALRSAQRSAVGGGGPEALRDATRTHRDRLDDLTSLARNELGADGPTLQRVVQTLRGASVDKETAKVLIAGTLAGDVEQSGFGPLLSAVPAGTARHKPTGKPKPTPKQRAARPQPAPKPKPPPKPKPDPRAAQRARIRERLEKARARVRELEARLAELGG
jgi:hypothetical protein